MDNINLLIVNTSGFMPKKKLPITKVQCPGNGNHGSSILTLEKGDIKGVVDKDERALYGSIYF